MSSSTASLPIPQLRLHNPQPVKVNGVPARPASTLRWLDTQAGVVEVNGRTYRIGFLPADRDDGMGFVANWILTTPNGRRYVVSEFDGGLTCSQCGAECRHCRMVRAAMIGLDRLGAAEAHFDSARDELERAKRLASEPCPF